MSSLPAARQETSGTPALAANKGLTPGFRDLRLRIFCRRLFRADSYESPGLHRHFYQCWPSLKSVQTMTNRSPHMALRELCSPAWLCHTCGVERPLGPTGGCTWFLQTQITPILVCRTIYKHHPLLGTHVGIHSATGTLFGAPKPKSPEQTWVNVPTVWSRLQWQL